jgi:hypothetical protein
MDHLFLFFLIGCLVFSAGFDIGVVGSETNALETWNINFFIRPCFS